MWVHHRHRRLLDRNPGMKVQNEANGNLNDIPVGVRKQRNSDPHRLNDTEGLLKLKIGTVK